MSFAKTFTASAMAISMVLASSAAYAEAKPSAASKLSLAGSPAMQTMRATNLKQKNASQISPLYLGLIVLLGGLGIAAIAGAFGGSDSP